MRMLLAFVLIIFIAFMLSDCKKCRVCICEKNGQVYEEKSCGYKGLSNNKSFDTWELYLKEEKGYDKVTCKTE